MPVVGAVHGGLWKSLGFTTNEHEMLLDLNARRRTSVTEYIWQSRIKTFVGFLMPYLNQNVLCRVRLSWSDGPECSYQVQVSVVCSRPSTNLGRRQRGQPSYANSKFSKPYITLARLDSVTAALPAHAMPAGCIGQSVLVVAYRTWWELKVLELDNGW